VQADLSGEPERRVYVVRTRRAFGRYGKKNIRRLTTGGIKYVYKAVSLFCGSEYRTTRRRRRSGTRFDYRVRRGGTVPTTYRSADKSRDRFWRFDAFDDDP